MKVGLKISTTYPFSMFRKVLISLVGADLGLEPSLLPPIIHVIMVDHLIFILMVITEVDTEITPANFLHITMVE